MTKNHLFIIDKNKLHKHKNNYNFNSSFVYTIKRQNYKSSIEILYSNKKMHNAFSIHHWRYRAAPTSATQTTRAAQKAWFFTKSPGGRHTKKSPR